MNISEIKQLAEEHGVNVDPEEIRALLEARDKLPREVVGAMGKVLESFEDPSSGGAFIIVIMHLVREIERIDEGIKRLTRLYQ